MHFCIILHDLDHPSGSLISLYEWSLEQLKTRNFHPFLKRFWPLRNWAPANFWWISRKMKVKLWNEKCMQFRSSIRRVAVFMCFCTSLKNHIHWDDMRWRVKTFANLRPPQNHRKNAFPGVPMRFGQGTQGTEITAIEQFYFFIQYNFGCNSSWGCSKCFSEY